MRQPQIFPSGNISLDLHPLHYDDRRSGRQKTKGPRQMSDPPLRATLVRTPLSHCQRPTYPPTTCNRSTRAYRDLSTQRSGLHPQIPLPEGATNHRCRTPDLRKEASFSTETPGSIYPGFKRFNSTLRGVGVLSRWRHQRSEPLLPELSEAYLRSDP